MPNDANPSSTVAVIIPCYNAAPYLARALESVLAQTCRDYRIYVIDDGSTDGTTAVLRSYGQRIISARQSHAGQASARNHGICLSTSPYVAFLDADDEWLPAKLERQVKILRQEPQLGMLYSDCSTSGTGRFAGSYFARVGTPAGGRVFEQFLKTCPVFTPTVMVRRECLENVGLFNESLPVGEDYNLWLRIAAHWEVGVIPEVLAIRHMTPGSLSLTTSAERAASTIITVFEDVMKACPELAPHQLVALRKAIGKRYYNYGSYLLAKGDHEGSRDQLLQTWHYGLRDWRTIAKLGLGFLPHAVFASLQRIRKQLKGSRLPDLGDKQRNGNPQGADAQVKP